MKILITSVIILAIFLSAGCSTVSNKTSDNMLEAYKSFIQQQRSHELLVIRGDNIQLTLSGAKEVKMEAPLQPLSAFNLNADTSARIAEAVKTTILGTLGVLALKDIATQPPTVVTQPEPVIVKPDVVTMP